MATELCVLLLEDDPFDAELALALLAEGGFDCCWERVETRADFLRCLHQQRYDLILADYSLPSFDGLSALRLLQQYAPDTPFILLSGLMGEEAVIESLKAGATNYVLKEHLARLPPVVARALQEREESRQRQRAEEALYLAERRYRELFENAGDLLYTHDLAGQLTSVNRMVERLTGYSRDELIGQSIELLIAPEHRPFWDAQASALGAEAAPRREVELLCKDGSRLAVEISVGAILEAGRAIGVQGSARDISERRRAEEQRRNLEAQMLQSQKLEIIGSLAGGIAHDFNNILSAIMGNVQLALEIVPAQNEQADILREIEKYALRGAALTNQLLAFGRRQQLARTHIRLNDLITDLLRMLRRLIGVDIIVALDLDADLPQAWADQSQIEQVIMNLVINARDAMPAGGQLRIVTRRVTLDASEARDLISAQPGLYAQVSVCDSGVGIDAETQQHIFEPFFTTKRHGRGTGLGLAVVYGVIKQHEGGIQVASTPGAGTTFVFYLPAAS